MSDWREEDSLGKAYDARLMRRFLGRLRPHRALVLGCLALVFVQMALDLAGPLVVQRAIDGPVHLGDPDGLLRWTLVFLGVIAGLALVEFIEALATNLAGQRIIRDLRMDVFRHLQRLPQSFYDRTPVGRLVTRVTNDVENLNELFTSGLVELVGETLLLVGLLVVMFLISWKLTFVTLAVAPLFVLGALVFRRFARERYREMRVRIARLNSWLNETVQGIRTLQVFGRERPASARWGRLNGEFRESAVGVVFVYSLFFPAVELLSAAAIAAILWYGGLSIVDGSLSAGAFFAFWYCAQKVFRPVRNLAEKYNVLQAAMASSERIFALLDEPAPDDRGLQPAGALRGSIEFRDVSFSYDGRTPVLDGVSFSIEPGRTLAVVGVTGAGKTTIVNLLLRLYEPQSGSIRIDGRDLRTIDPRDLRKRVSLVLQDVFLFNGTVAENIALGEEMPRERILAASRAVQADRFVARLPQGYDSPVGERGSSLSSGERQLLSFARALAADPRVLVLDEATSSVDTENEQLLQEAVGRLLAGRTSIVIAHRLSTVRHADRIIVLHRGRIAEDGRHDELMATDGLYAKLVRLQFSPG